MFLITEKGKICIQKSALKNKELDGGILKNRSNYLRKNNEFVIDYMEEDLNFTAKLERGTN